MVLVFVYGKALLVGLYSPTFVIAGFLSNKRDSVWRNQPFRNLSATFRNPFRRPFGNLSETFRQSFGNISQIIIII